MVHSRFHAAQNSHRYAERSYDIANIHQYIPDHVQDFLFQMKDFSNLPYRPCVGVMLVNSHGKVFVGKRIDNREGD